MLSIFHTGHCGSSLLGALLSKSIPTYNEPNWTHLLNEVKNPVELVKQSYLANTLVKFPSPFCYLMPKLEGKKVFIYGTLYETLVRLMPKDSWLWQKDTMKYHLHEHTLNGLESTKPKDNAELLATLWADKMLWAMESKNTIFVPSKDLFDDPKKTCKRICNFLDIKYIETDINFHVKKAGLNQIDSPVNIDKVKTDKEYLKPYDVFDIELYKVAIKHFKNRPRLQRFLA